MKRKSKPIKFTASDLKSMQSDSTRVGIEFTLKQIQEVLDVNPAGLAQAIWDDFEQVGHPSGEYGMDTAVRDIWFSAIGYHFAGRDWPINADSAEVSKEFFSKLRNGLDKAKIKYT